MAVRARNRCMKVILLHSLHFYVRMEAGVVVSAKKGSG